MDSLRRVERSGKSWMRSVQSRRKRVFAKEEVPQVEFSPDRDFQEEKHSFFQDNFESAQHDFQDMTPEEVHRIVEVFRERGEDPIELLEMHTPKRCSSISGHESGHWIDSRG